MVAADEESSRDQDYQVFVDCQDAVDGDEDFLVVVVELVGCSEGILLAVPPQFLVHQRLQRLLV